ncbi:LacI family DNA-binding transcriptional regulator [Streptomyces sp. NPDC056656]|uniref:LacI family DNA-binding transcriptional regulator n=1 Tax=Streptomyces sp. NPDC056656 TaxID=3345895 RepID=UPI0036BCFDAC
MSDTRGAKDPHPTLRDVARQAKVSAMTVSRVLRDDPKVAPDTAARVRAVADELGYRRNEIARSLRLGGGTGLVGLVVTNLANPFYSRLALGVDAVVSGHGLKTVIGNTGHDLASERSLVEGLVARRVDGIIVVPAGDDQRHLAAAAAGGVPVVVASRPPHGFSADCVLVDDHGGACAATRSLLAAGHRRIGFVGSAPSVYTGAERLRGYTDALADAGIARDETRIRLGPQDTDEATRATAELLALPEPPTALFCSNNRNTIGAFRAIRAAGTDIALAGFDDFELADVLGLPLVIAAYDSDELGRQAGRLLVRRLGEDVAGRGPAPTHHAVIPTSLVRYGLP